MQPTMEIVVNDGRNRNAYPEASRAKVSGNLPNYRGGVTMTIQLSDIFSNQPSDQPAILIDPDVRGGIPCVGNAKLPISSILQSLASGRSPGSLVNESAGITMDDIRLALEAAAWIMQDPSTDWKSIDLQELVELQRELHAWQSLSNDNTNQF